MVSPAVANVSNVSFAWTSPDLRISWTGTGDGYSVRYRDQVADDWTAVADVTDDTGITIPGLVAGTHYDFEVITHKGTPAAVRIPKTREEAAEPQAAPLTGSSLPAYYGYIIPQGLTKPTACTLVSEGATQAAISWTGDAAKQHKVQWTDDTGFPQVMTVTGLTATITGLDAEKHYRINIAVTQGPETIWADCYLDKSKECCTAP